MDVGLGQSRVYGVIRRRCGFRCDTGRLDIGSCCSARSNYVIVIEDDLGGRTGNCFADMGVGFRAKGTASRVKGM